MENYNKQNNDPISENNDKSAPEMKGSRFEKAWFLPERNLADFSEVRNILSQYNPQTLNDIQGIEKGMENFLLFNESHLALFEESQLEHIRPQDLPNFEAKRLFARFQYFNFNEAGELTLRKVLLRPASLRGDLISRARNACVRGSAIALIKFIIHRNAFFRDLDTEGKLADLIVFRLKGGKSEGIDGLDAYLNPMDLQNLSFDRFLESEYKPSTQLLNSVLHYLSADNHEILEDLKLNSDLADDITGFLEGQMGNSILRMLAPEFHVPIPTMQGLIEVSENDFREVRTEMEYIYILFVRTARKLLIQGLPHEETSWIDREGTHQDRKYLEQLRLHPSLIMHEGQDISLFFLEAYESLINEVHQYTNIRHNLLLEVIMSNTIKRLNGQFEPYLFEPRGIRMPESLQKRFHSKEELFPRILQRIQQTGEVLMSSSPERRSGSIYLLYKYNLPRAFIRNKNIRAMLNGMAKSSGFNNGVYDFLIPVDEKTHPSGVVTEQLEFAKAIREWEEDLRKEREKREKQKQSLFERIINSIALFLEKLISTSSDRKVPEKKQSSPREEETETTEREGLKRTGVILGPRERRKPIPPKIQKAIDYIERQNRGIIWIDQVVNALSSVKYNDNNVGDFLFYDQEGRYVEIRSMIRIRRVFVRLENHDNPEWRKSIIEYLENISNPPHGVTDLLSFYRTIT